MKKLKRYMIDEIDSELTAVSLVDSPAIESDFQYFNSQDSKRYVKLENEEKRLVIGAALVPDMDIYRYDAWTGEEFYISFSRKCIEKLADKFMKNNLGHNWSLDHEMPTDGVYVFESWIKEDMEKDKSVALGIDPTLPEGTWFISARINDNEIWDKVKAGKWHGFSVEAFCVLDELNFSKQNNMNEINESFWSRLKEVFAEVLNHSEEEVVEQPTAEVELEENAVVEEPEKEEETLADNVAEVEAEADVPEEVYVTVEQEEEVKAEEEAEKIEASTNLEALEAKVKELQESVEKLLEQNAELKKQNEKLSAMPSAEPVKVNAEKAQNPFDIIRSLHDGTYKK